ncbi:MAG: hypothetical protein EXR54_02915 [Dehalococcoidia bacterium]|nr:hypothetical protein [Dehalococcoidia bacterium]MSQ16508.1 hypothetical protein [Dehalococcoidia bacterium]
MRKVWLLVLMAAGVALLVAFPACGQPAPTIIPALTAGGDASSGKIMRIAWTFDDGPHPQHTGPMRQVMESRGITQTTWFVQYNRINNDVDANVAKMLEIQRLGGEIGIHAVDPVRDHLSWFPMTDKASYDDIDAAMRDLKAFHQFLTGKGLKVKFVRPPYDLYSELLAYLQKVGYEGDARQAVRDIVAGKPVTGQAQQVKAAYDTMQAELQSLGLHLSGGASAGQPETTLNSWEAEASGHMNRSDNVTRHVSPERLKHPDQAKANPGAFERAVDQITPDQPRSLIVLAHDTFAVDVTEVGVDVDTMDAYAELQGVKIEYYTMSGLYEILRGAPP